MWITASIGVAHEHRRVVDDGVVDALGEVLLQLLHGRADVVGRSRARWSRAPGRSAIATADLLSSSERSAYSAAPSSMRATSRSRVICAAAPVLTMMSPNSSVGLQAALRVDAELEGRCPSSMGGAPTTAAGDLHVLLADRAHHVAARSARARRSSADRARCAWRSRRAPNSCTSPTPSIRASASLTLQHRVVAQVHHVVAVVGRDQVHDHGQVGRALDRGDAELRTSSGSRGSACCTRFCTSCCARSRSVPSLKVTVSVIVPSLVAWTTCRACSRRR